MSLTTISRLLLVCLCLHGCTYLPQPCRPELIPKNLHEMDPGTAWRMIGEAELARCQELR